MASIDFTDGAGSATLNNGKPAPGDRFSNWVPAPIVIGPRATPLGGGPQRVFRFRTDYTASFSILHLPNTSLLIAQRFIEWYQTDGATWTVNTADLSLNSYTCCAAPDARPPALALSNKTQLEYTLGPIVVANASVTPAPLLCIYR